MIVGQYITVQLGMIYNFKHNILKYDDDEVTVKTLDCHALDTGKTNLTSSYIQEV